MRDELIGQCPRCGGSLTAHHICPSDMLDQLSPGLNFSTFRSVNMERKARWHASANRKWIGPDWGNELAGETGECCNEIKKMQRFADGIPQYNFDPALAERKLMKEIGDVVICAELIAEHFGLKLEDCVRYAFNLTSEKNGFPERL